jgi:hypothetical protein
MLFYLVPGGFSYLIEFKLEKIIGIYKLARKVRKRRLFTYLSMNKKKFKCFYFYYRNPKIFVNE